MAEFIGTDGKDRFIGNELEVDEFTFALRHLTRADTVEGGGGEFRDRLIIGTYGFLDFNVVNHVTGIEEIYLAELGNRIDLTKEFVESAAGRTLEIFGSKRDDSVQVAAHHSLSADESLVIHGAGGNDDLYGGEGDDTIYGDNGDDQLAGQLAGSDLVYGGAGNDIVTASLNDTIFGGRGNDEINADGSGSIIDGGAGFDTLFNFGPLNLTSAVISNVEVLLIGFDVYATIEEMQQFEQVLGPGVDGAALRLISGGTIDFSRLVPTTRDIVFSVVADPASARETYDITGGLRRNMLTGAAWADTLSGHGENDTLAGGGGADILEGRGGDDQLTGGKGNDTLRGGEGDDVLRDARPREQRPLGADLFRAGQGNDTIYASGLKDIVDAGEGHDQIFGNAASIDGGEGQDAYYATGTLSDTVNIETLGAIGRISATVSQILAFDKIIGPGNRAIELTLSGSGRLALAQRFERHGADVVLSRSASDIDLIGTFFADSLQGNFRSDTLAGGSGDDLLVGRGGADLLYGGDGNDTLEGGAGADTLAGGTGDDTYYLGATVDRVHESGAFDEDTIVSVRSWILGQNFEHLRLLGTASLSGTGNSWFNNIAGNDGDNLLSGLGENDTLSGGLGHDTLAGGDGQDRFVFDTPVAASNVDVIADFYYLDDIIALARDVFSELGRSVEKREFAIGSEAESTEQRILYDAESGAVLYDSDGTGPIAAVQFAQIGSGLSIAYSDFTVIS